jgi:hypothetical protein
MGGNRSRSRRLPLIAAPSAPPGPSRASIIFIESRIPQLTEPAERQRWPSPTVISWPYSRCQQMDTIGDPSRKRRHGQDATRNALSSATGVDKSRHIVESRALTESAARRACAEVCVNARISRGMHLGMRTLAGSAHDATHPVMVFVPIPLARKPLIDSIVSATKFALH